MIANSENVKERIREYYDRDSLVIYPPVDIDNFRARESEDYFLAVQRPSPEKRPEMLLEIFRKVPKEKLILVGDYIDKDYIARIGNLVDKLNNVTWLRNVSQAELIDLYSHCKALIQTAEYEDFGVAPVEAMASGKPVIAVDEGGFKETVLGGETGILVKKPYIENFINTIRNFDFFDFSPKICEQRARMFSKEKFIKKMKMIVKNVLASS